VGISQTDIQDHLHLALWTTRARFDTLSSRHIVLTDAVAIAIQVFIFRSFLNASKAGSASDLIRSFVSISLIDR
jgi:hypothetical protein